MTGQKSRSRRTLLDYEYTFSAHRDIAHMRTEFR